MLFRNAAGLALLSTLLLASWDEWHQSFLPGRTSSPKDVALDFCGAVVAQLVLFWIAILAHRRLRGRLAVA
jgi:VanZ family protein